MNIEPIGIIHTPFMASKGTPIQPVFSEGIEGTVELYPHFAEGLADLDGFGRIWLLYWFDRSCETRLTVVPFRDDREHGLFSTRAPCRPNPVGMSSVRLLGIEGAKLRVADVDMLDGTPLIDVKPYVPAFDVFADARAGWLDTSSGRSRADDRFRAEE